MFDHPSRTAAPTDALQTPAAAPRPACPRCGLELAWCEGGEPPSWGESTGAWRGCVEALAPSPRWACPEPYCSFADGELEPPAEAGARRTRSSAALEETQYANEGSAWLQALRRAG
jgi:hypothetical protein